MGLLSKFHSSDDVVEEGLLLIDKLLLLLRGPVHIILVIINGDKLSMSNFDLFFQKEFDLNFGKVNMGLALSNYQV